ncbi:peptidase, M23 family [Segatella baroniae F0067]|uniref:Peptidase, M23 family n=2 Tax=Segatella baroniae TaxID=305719 RepID=U2QJX0_9BACT|nr:peptidase, M23 family [Segatella baroniae F0067]
MAIATLFALTTLPVAAQDLLARQAPVDRKMKAVDTLIFKSLTAREEMESPAAQLYEDFNNKYAHRIANVPDSFKISLRHFCMPTTSRVVTSNFGARWGRQHKGLDIKVYIGDTIRAAFSGKVRIVKYEAAGYGKYIVIRHPNGLETIYGHLSAQLVAENQVVRAGEPIGLGGNTGRSTGSHLHFETRLCGMALNPALMFDFRNQDVTGDYYVYNARTYDEESELASRVRGKIGNGGYTQEMVRGDYVEKENAAEEIVYYKAKAGESLATIAKKRGISVDRLCELNRITKSTRIRPGQILRCS